MTAPTPAALRAQIEALKVEKRSVSLQPTRGSTRDLSLDFDRTAEQIEAEIRELREELAVAGG